MADNRLRSILVQSDREGERAIALFQALIATLVVSMHFASVSSVGLAGVSPVTLAISAAIFALCAARFRLARDPARHAVALHALSVADGLLIFMLVLSYAFAYGLPLQSAFKAPTLIFLVLYTGIRVLRFDPMPVLVAGVTVLAGWGGLILAGAFGATPLAQSYPEYMTSSRLFIPGVAEMAAGYAALVLALAVAMTKARKILTESAHVDDLRETQRLAVENSERLEALLSSSVDAIAITGEDFRIERANPAFQRLFGASEAELAGCELSSLLVMPSHDGGRPKVGQVFEAEGKGPGGDAAPVEVSISDFIASGLRSHAVFVRDVRKRRQAEENERQARALFRDAVNSAMDAIIIIDEEGSVVSFNPAAEAIFGYSVGEVLGANMADFIVPERHRGAHERGMRHYLATGEGPVLEKRIEIQAMRKDGEEFDVELAITPVTGPEGRLFIGYARDITERKTVEHRLKAEKERAENANRAKASFLAMMSHEVRTPLNGLMGVVELLDETELDEEQRDYIDIARHSGTAMLEIINEILDFSKLEAGRLTIEERIYEPSAILEGVAALLKPMASGKRIGITVDIAAGVPAKLVGDPGRVRQVILNFASNAVKFTEKGGVTISASVAGEPAARRLVLAVKDTGTGIAPEKHGLVFREFTTLGGGQPGSGTGLGLAISKRLAEAMGGEVGFESEAGAGSTFWTRLPLNECMQADGVHGPMSSGEGRASAFQGMRILVAEDNASNQMVMRRNLEQLGASVEIVSDGIDAVEAVRGGSFDAVLMDVSIPGMSGIEATAAIRRLDPPAGRVPIIVITGYAFESDRRKAFEAGADGHLAKPVSRAELSLTLSRIFTQTDKGSEAEAVANVIDGGVLEEILEGLGSEERARFVGQFARDIEGHARRACEAAAAGDLEQMERATHSLKGVAGTIGGRALQELASQLNDRLRHSGAMADGASVEALADEAAALLMELAAYGAAASQQEEDSRTDAGEPARIPA